MKKFFNKLFKVATYQEEVSDKFYTVPMEVMAAVLIISWLLV